MKQVILACLLLSGITFANAALDELANGLVNDSTLNITWLQDANAFKTLCDAGNPISIEFHPEDAANAGAICTANGRMTWNDAGLWVAWLNEQNYRNYSDWRLPSTEIDPTCIHNNCTNSEMSHLYRVSLGNSDTLVNVGPFQNLQHDVYWSGTLHPEWGDAFFYQFAGGAQDSDNFGNLFHVWPVRFGLSIASEMTELEVKIQELYVGILGRAADRPGMDYWRDQINDGTFTLENTRSAFTDPAQAEYTEIYGGLDNTQLVIAIYENFLERAPDAPGLDYWVDELDNGRVNADQMINAIINAVQDPNATGELPARDLATLTNKTEAAIYFTEQTKEFMFDMAYREMARVAVVDVTDNLETLHQSWLLTDEYVGNSGNEGFLGAWYLTVTEVYSSCGQEFGWNADITITRSGSEFVVTGIKDNSDEEPVALSATVVDRTITTSPGDFRDDEGVTTSTFTMQLAPDGNTISGQETWTWKGDMGGTCANGTATLSAVR